MTDAEILKELHEIFHDVFDDDSIVLTPATTAKDIPEWDSFHHVSLIVGAEVRFGIKFQTAELEALQNVGEMVVLIARKLAQK